MRQHEILFESERVYHNPEKDDNLALFFFKDGLKELTFKKNISKEEIEEFLRIIALDFEREAVDDDIVTLLWERDFENIKYITDESFLIDEEEYEPELAGQTVLQGTETDELLRAYSDAFRAEDVKTTTIMNLTERDLQPLVREIEKDSEDKTGRLVEILFEMLSQAETDLEYDDIYHFLKDALSYSLKNANLKTSVELLRNAKDFVEEPSTPEAIRQHLNLLFRFANSEEAIRYVSEIFESSLAVDEGVLDEYIIFLDKTAIPSFIAALGELSTMHARKLAIHVLIRIGKKDIQSLTRGLHDSRWYVVRNIIYILRHIGDKRAVDYILNTLTHPEVKVRKEAIKALGELKSPVALHPLKELLYDPDHSLRKASADAIGRIGSEAAKKMLIEKISEKRFAKKDFEERKEFYEVLSRWNDKEVSEHMLRQIRKRSFFRRSRNDENRACAAYSLGLMGIQDALPLLHKMKESKNKLLREYVNAAINRINHGR
jgi:HEAT repeat protein